eukprot:TRINITY_DN4180_c0_g1_i1.p1 TRINITY_DN4180_c0_g1~~TRINITY_DN4180_c0_g1_i1.p1  ORF type:complete len:385 (-),score=19.04 TRINITY_DN4180_c0_g1_i1:61-1215(-)
MRIIHLIFLVLLTTELALSLLPAFKLSLDLEQKKKKSLKHSSQLSLCLEYECADVGDSCVSSLNNLTIPSGLNNGDKYGPVCKYAELGSLQPIDCVGGRCERASILTNRGASCSSDDDCGYFVSDRKIVTDKLYCISGQCDLENYLSKGDDCRDPRQCLSSLCNSGKCSDIAVGQSCNISVSDFACEFGTYCDVNRFVCTPWLSVGSPCSQNDVCDETSNCAPNRAGDNVCQALYSVSEGDYCASVSYCEWGLACLNNVCQKPRTDVECLGSQNCQTGEICLCYGDGKSRCYSPHYSKSCQGPYNRAFNCLLDSKCYVPFTGDSGCDCFDEFECYANCVSTSGLNTIDDDCQEYSNYCKASGTSSVPMLLFNLLLMLFCCYFVF